MVELLRLPESPQGFEPLDSAQPGLHPASRILIYLLAALGIPGLPFFLVPIPLSLALIVLLVRRKMPLRLIWRTRWLLLVLTLGYAYSLPGDPMWQGLGELSPSWEGCRYGVEQSARLVVLLLWLDVLVLGLSPGNLLVGLYQLMQPISRIGFDPRRVALRLGLTLRAIEGMERGRGNLGSILKLEFPIALPERIQLKLYPLRLLDKVIPGLIFLGLLLHGMSVP